ncbi:uncharacterized protein LAJ45_10937 [Morchella importuna]|uniref:uncharacterized protein n=1 Tax=Morchella importuna TaxID=1174673 RepID=UPI001E8E7FA7|nr:uncharacterized protein LAJ45_10937 [Morchella importuna]KAH8145027.1 hypothetical protein LAJ45_10937 [Morchella importuna]
MTIHKPNHQTYTSNTPLIPTPPHPPPPTPGPSSPPAPASKSGKSILLRPPPIRRPSRRIPHLDPLLDRGDARSQLGPSSALDGICLDAPRDVGTEADTENELEEEDAFKGDAGLCLDEVDGRDGALGTHVFHGEVKWCFLICVDVCLLRTW